MYVDHAEARPGSYTRFQCDWDSLGIDEDGLRDKAISSIRDRHTPAVIGTGWLSHYPLAFGYAWEQVTVQYCFIFCWTETEIAAYFYVDEGWGGGGAGDSTAPNYTRGPSLPGPLVFAPPLGTPTNSRVQSNC